MAKFIAIEGIDGSGTSTQGKAIAAALAARGEESVATFEPSTGPVGRLLRELLAGNITSSGRENVDRRLFAHLFAADRADHLENAEWGMRQDLKRGRHVVCARYVMSSLAYEGEDAGETELVNALNEGFPIPDLTVYLDCPVEVALERIRTTRENIDVFENEAKLSRVRANYLRIVEEYPGEVLTVDATLPADDITRQALLEI